MKNRVTAVVITLLLFVVAQPQEAQAMSKHEKVCSDLWALWHKSQDKLQGASTGGPFGWAKKYSWKRVVRAAQIAGIILKIEELYESLGCEAAYGVSLRPGGGSYSLYPQIMQPSARSYPQSFRSVRR